MDSSKKTFIIDRSKKYYYIKYNPHDLPCWSPSDKILDFIDTGHLYITYMCKRSFFIFWSEDIYDKVSTFLEAEWEKEPDNLCSSIREIVNPDNLIWFIRDHDIFYDQLNYGDTSSLSEFLNEKYGDTYTTDDTLYMTSL